jgi:D-glycero-D-manno-heptose 1,7-bisphosphate phosphatase
VREALILAGGIGSRLGPLTAETPKPLLEVGGRPFVDHLIWNLGRHGIKRVVVSAGFRADLFEEHFASAPARGVETAVVVEPEPLGTGGALAFACRELHDDEALVLNGDTLFDFNYLDLALLRRETGARLALALRQVPDAHRYGAVTTDGTRALSFAEKVADGPGFVSAGVYAVETALLRSLSAAPHSFEKEVLPGLVAAGDVSARAYPGWFVDIGTHESIEYARAGIEAWRDKSAVLFDRDGVLNVDHGHVATPERFEWVPGAPEAIRDLNDRGVLAIAITNQAGIAKGYYSEEEYLRFEAWISGQLAETGAHLDATYHCPHHPDYGSDCDCRKPRPGMVLAALRDFDVDPHRAVLIGDKPSDMQAAEAAGVAGVMYDDGDLRALVERTVSDMGAR